MFRNFSWFKILRPDCWLVLVTENIQLPCYNSFTGWQSVSSLNSKFWLFVVITYKALCGLCSGYLKDCITPYHLSRSLRFSREALLCSTIFPSLFSEDTREGLLSGCSQALECTAPRSQIGPFPLLFLPSGKDLPIQADF